MTAVFPALPGLGWSVKKAPSFKTRVQQAVSGRELRLSDQPVPTWDFTLTYNFLRDDNDSRGSDGLGSGYDELRTLLGFFAAQQGQLSTFLFDDPTDDTAVGVGLGAGNGSTTQFQLVRPLPGGFAEPIIAPNVVSHVYQNGTDSGGWSVNAGNGVVTFATAPASGVVITADFTYYFLCRFADDSTLFENFMFQLWQGKEIKLKSVLL